jgi:hypothetical protein
MPTFADALHAELTHSGALERIRTWVDAHLKPWIEACTVESQKMCVGTVQMAGAIAERAEESFPSKAYGPYLEAQGFAPFLARGLGSLTISLGTRQANEARAVAPVAEAIRFLATSDRQRRAILRQAKVVLAASKETSIVDDLFLNSGLSKGELLSLLQPLVGRLTASELERLPRRWRFPCLAPEGERPARRRRRTSYSLRRMHPSASRAGTRGAITNVISSTRKHKPLGRNLAALTFLPGPPVGGSSCDR